MDSTYIVSCVRAALALIAVSITAMLTVPGGFVEGGARFKRCVSFVIYYISSYTCLVASTISLLTLLAAMQTEQDQVSFCFLKYGAIWPIYLGVVAVMVCAASMHSLMHKECDSWIPAVVTLIVTSVVIIGFCNSKLVCRACIWLKNSVCGAYIWLKNKVRVGGNQDEEPEDEEAQHGPEEKEAEEKQPLLKKNY